MKNRHSFEVGRSSYHFERRVLLMCCQAVGTVRALTIYILASAEDWDSYLELKMPDIESPSFRDDYLLSSMMSKHPRLPNLSHDRRHVAVGKWRKAEDSCRIANEHWRRYCTSPRTSNIDDTLVRKVQDVIRFILGPLSRADLAFVQKHSRFGPGATSSVSGDYVVPSRKFTSRWDVSLGLLPYFPSLVPHIEGFRSPSGNVSDGNKVTFVPKSSKTDRAIAIEPHMNIYAQLGIGALLRTRLLKVGIDLSIQKFKNREAVLHCQEHQRCTIDLSSASDTIAYLTVMNLLPFEWFWLLDIARSTHSSLDGELIELEKFSSMGNGFTFELETLIFYAVCAACGDWSADVFGDDLIVRQDCSSDVVSALNTFGFSVNADKTYLAGRFFESCGVDVHDGVNIRPFFLKGKYETVAHQSIRTANAVRLYAHRRNNSFGCDKRFLHVWLECIKHSSLARKTFASFPYDNGLWRDFDECCPSRYGSHESHSGWDGWLGKVYSGSPTTSNKTIEIGAYIGGLAFGPAETPRSVEYRREATKGHRIRTMCCFGTWRDLGPWI